MSETQPRPSESKSEHRTRQSIPPTASGVTVPDPIEMIRQLGVHSVISVAEELGLFEQMVEPITAETLADRIGIDPRGLEALLRALTQSGVVIAENQTYMANVRVLRTQAALVDRLKERLQGRESQPGFDRVEGASENYPAGVSFMRRIMGPTAAVVASRLADDGSRVLDLGCGAATWSLPIVQCNPASRVTAFDLPTVLPRARETVEAAGFLDRYEFRAGDAFKGELGSGYSLALLGNFCHLFGADDNSKLFSRCFQALNKGGRIAVVGLIAGGDPRGGLEHALHHLSLYARTDGGGHHAFERYAEWLAGCGFRGVEIQRLTMYPYVSLVTANKPG